MLPRPVKKYSAGSSGDADDDCILKPVLSLPEIHEIIRGLVSERRVEEMIRILPKSSSVPFRKSRTACRSSRNHDRETLYRKAVGLALEAAARRIAAERDSLPRCRRIVLLRTRKPKEQKEGRRRDAQGRILMHPAGKLFAFRRVRLYWNCSDKCAVRIRAYADSDLDAVLSVWNEVVEEGIAFPQGGAAYAGNRAGIRRGQSYTGVAEDEMDR